MDPISWGPHFFRGFWMFGGPFCCPECRLQKNKTGVVMKVYVFPPKKQDQKFHKNGIPQSARICQENSLQKERAGESIFIFLLINVQKRLGW